jgi:DnaJ-class molecular chaperone
MVKDTILYSRLEVGINASENDIKKAYARLSRIWHPDKNPNNIEEATKKFQDINEAKEILLNSEKRAVYDNIGMDIINGGIQSQQQPHNNSNFFENIINQHFSFNINNNNNQHSNNSNNEMHENIVANLHVTLEQIYNQDIISFQYKQKIYCNKCDGNGTKNGLPPTCNECSGKGVRIQIIKLGFMVQQLMCQCNNCNGSGKIITEECETCNGCGHNFKDKNISIPLKSGLTTGNKISLNAKGHQFKNNKTDLVLTINEIPHTIFKREHDNLLINIELKLYQALLGFNKLITHLDGKKLNISYIGKTEYGTIRIIENFGMQTLNSSNKGDLIINFIYILPNIQNELKLQVKTLLQDKDEINNENELNKLDITKIILS